MNTFTLQLNNVASSFLVLLLLALIFVFCFLVVYPLSISLSMIFLWILTIQALNTRPKTTIVRYIVMDLNTLQLLHLRVLEPQKLVIPNSAGIGRIGSNLSNFQFCFLSSYCCGFHLTFFG